jgi:UDP-N-acetylmuramyl pentapeptide phosphotransferase/UDP-N-acetylglucosamine-1-phosphate transferase
VPDSELCTGFLLGFATATLLGVIFQRLYLLSKKAAQASKKVALVETKQSPKQVYMASVRAQTEMIIWIIALILVAVAAVWIFLSS